MILTATQWDAFIKKLDEPLSPEKMARISASYKRGKEMWDKMNKVCPHCGKQR